MFHRRIVTIMRRLLLSVTFLHGLNRVYDQISIATHPIQVSIRRPRVRILSYNPYPHITQNSGTLSYLSAISHLSYSVTGIRVNALRLTSVQTTMFGNCALTSNEINVTICQGSLSTIFHNRRHVTFTSCIGPLIRLLLFFIRQILARSRDEDSGRRFLTFRQG